MVPFAENGGVEKIGAPISRHNLRGNRCSGQRSIVSNDCLRRHCARLPFLQQRCARADDDMRCAQHLCSIASPCMTVTPRRVIDIFLVSEDEYEMALRSNSLCAPTGESTANSARFVRRHVFHASCSATRVTLGRQAAHPVDRLLQSPIEELVVPVHAWSVSRSGFDMGRFRQAHNDKQRDDGSRHQQISGR
jgi:hypothetical protein